MKLKLSLFMMLSSSIDAFASAWAIGKGQYYIDNTIGTSASSFPYFLQSDFINIDIDSNIKIDAEKNYYEYGLTEDTTFYGFLEAGKVTEQMQFIYNILPVGVGKEDLPKGLTLDYTYAAYQFGLNYQYMQEGSKAASVGFEFNPAPQVITQNFKIDSQLHSVEAHLDLGISTETTYSNIRLGNKYYYNLGRVSPVLTFKFAKKSSFADLEVSLNNYFLHPSKNLSPLFKMVVEKAKELEGIGEPFKDALMAPSYSNIHTLMIKASINRGSDKEDAEEGIYDKRFNIGLYSSLDGLGAITSRGILLGVSRRF